MQTLAVGPGPDFSESMVATVARFVFKFTVRAAATVTGKPWQPRLPVSP
jgi:hypothetical protein